MLGDHADALPTHGAPDRVLHLRHRGEDHAPPRGAEAPTQVDVLHEHEVGGIEAVDLFEGRSAQGHAAARQPVDVAFALVVPVGQSVASGPRVVAPHQAEQRMADGRGDVGERPRGQLQPPVGEHHLGSGGTDVGAVEHVVTEAGDRPGGEDGVGVGDHHHVGRGLANADVGGPTEAEVRQGHPLHVGMALGHRRQGSVAGSGVDHDDLVGTRVAEAVQAGQQVVPGVVVDHHDGRPRGRPVGVGHAISCSSTFRESCQCGMSGSPTWRAIRLSSTE